MEARTIWLTLGSVLAAGGFAFLAGGNLVGWPLLALGLGIILGPLVQRKFHTIQHRIRQARVQRKELEREQNLNHVASHHVDGETIVLVLEREDKATPASGAVEVTHEQGNRASAKFSRARLDGDAANANRVVIRFPDDFDEDAPPLLSGKYEVTWKQGRHNRGGDLIGLKEIAWDEFRYQPLPEPTEDESRFPAAQHIRHKNCVDNPRFEAFYSTRASGKKSLVTRCQDCGGQVVEVPGWTSSHRIEGYGVELTVSGNDSDGIFGLRCLVTDPRGNSMTADRGPYDRRTPQTQEHFRFPQEFKGSPIGGLASLPDGECAVVWMAHEPKDDSASDTVQVAADSFWIKSGVVYNTPLHLGTS